MKFSQEALRRAIHWLFLAPAGLATLCVVIPAGSARTVCLQIAGLLLALNGVLLLFYVVRFGQAFLAFLVKRLSWMLVTLLGITLITFVVMRFAPGDPVSALSEAGGALQGAIGMQMQREVSRAKKELLGILASYSYRARATDPDGDPVRLEFDWGDGTSPDSSREVPSGSEVERVHAWSQPGDYSLRVRAIDVHGARSDWSSPLRVKAGQGGSLPGTPSRPRGPSVAPVGGPGATNHPPLVPGHPKGPTTVRLETTILEQYFTWLTRVARLDFGKSYVHNSEVWPLIWRRLPTTLILSALSLLFAYLIAIPIGVYSSTHRDTLSDHCLSVVIFVLYSLPSFWVATMLIVLVADYHVIPVMYLACSDPSVHEVGPAVNVKLLNLCLAGMIALGGWRFTRRNGFGPRVSLVVGSVAGLVLLAAALYFVPATETTTAVLCAALPLTAALLALTWVPRKPFTKRALLEAGGVALATLFVLVFVWRLSTFDLFWHALLPVTCLTYGSLAGLSRYARSGMLDVVRQDYVRTARAKGLPERTVIFKHALRNGLIPILTLFAGVFPRLISGAVIVEYIFTVKGMGLLIVDSIHQRDYNVIMAVTTLTAVMTMVGLLLSDVLYVIVDPRISFEKRTSF